MYLLALLTLARAAEPVDATPGPAATTWSPLRVHLDCQTQERVDICTYIQGSLDKLPVVRVVPQSDAQVILHLNATSEDVNDFIQLRAVNDDKSGVASAPLSFEQQVRVDYRLPVDDQRAALDPPLDRVLAPYLSLAIPGAVTVTLAAPANASAIAGKTTPWALSVWAGGYGNWSQDYKNLSAWSGLSIVRKTNDNEQEVWANYNRSIDLQPSLVIGSTKVALTSDSTDIEGGSSASWNLTKHWTVGENIGGGHDDPQGQYLATARARAGVEYNLFPSDDPRGNVLAAALLLGGQADWYNTTNTLGQDTALFPTDILVGSGSVRVDTVQLTAYLSARSQLYPFFQRYLFSGSVQTTLTIGDHVDLQVQIDATQQAIPGPATIDTSNYEAVTRASYAQPLEVQGSFDLKFHWDNTNSARNNRFNEVENINVTGGL